MSIKLVEPRDKSLNLNPINSMVLKRCSISILRTTTRALPDLQTLYISLQETHFKIHDLFTQLGYWVHCTNSTAGNCACGGMAILIRDILLPAPVYQPLGCSVALPIQVTNCFI